jgi:ribosome biogenesis protein YTM1
MYRTLTIRYILLSSYLSHLQVLPMSTTQEPLWTLPLPTTLGATCATWVSPNTVDTNILLAAGGVDRQTHIFQIPSLLPSSEKPKELYTLHGHTGPVSSVLSSETGEVITSSWDGSINVYVLPPSSEEVTAHQTEAEPLSYLAQRDLKKRRKIGEDGPRGPIEGLTDGEIGTGGWRRMPDGVLKGHKGRVGALGWAGKDVGKVVYSGGWDGSLRGWDVETGANVVVRVSFLFCFQLRSIPPLSFSAVAFKLCLTCLEHLPTP